MNNVISIASGMAAPTLAARFIGSVGWKKAAYIGAASVVASMVIDWILSMQGEK